MRNLARAVGRPEWAEGPLFRCAPTNGDDAIPTPFLSALLVLGLRKQNNAEAGGRSMTRTALTLPHRSWYFLPILLAASQTAFAQESGQQQLGMRLFNQSCRVCHTKPQLASPQYAPVLSMKTLGGNSDIIRQVISNGTPRMPGFKYDFKPKQIDAIIAYIKTIPAPADAGPAPAKAASPRGAD
jgi:mono/diheme cytochrome c family protein